MAAQRKYPDELRERAVRMVLEIREQDGKGQGEISRVARQLDVHPEALRSWLQQAEIDGESGPARRRMISSGSLNWSVRYVSSGGRMRS
jgi:transposase